MFDIPYILFKNLEIDNIIIAMVAFAVASMVNAEAQNYVSMFFGNDIKKSKRAFSFNPLAHFDFFALISFVLLGFGWSRKIDIDYEKINKKQFFIIKTAGVFANFFFANIISSILYMLGKFSTNLINEKVLNIVLITNLSFFIYNLFLPIPPFSSGKILTNFLFFKNYKKNETKIYYIGLFTFIVFFFFDYFVLQGVVFNNINKLTTKCYKIIMP